MDAHDPLMVGMFWGGVIVAAVPTLLTLGVGIYVLRHYLGRSKEERPDQSRRG